MNYIIFKGKLFKFFKGRVKYKISKETACEYIVNQKAIPKNQDFYEIGEINYKIKGETNDKQTESYDNGNTLSDVLDTRCKCKWERIGTVNTFCFGKC